MAETTNDNVFIVIRCPNPQCSQHGIPRETVVSRATLSQMVQPGENDKVICATCGHVWSLSAEEKENTRKAFAAGTL